MQLPAILSDQSQGDAAGLLKRYYTEKVHKGRVRTGAQFDSWAGGGDAPAVSNTITADDLLAASLLSVPFEPAAVIGILDTRRDRICDLLSQIPANLDLAELREGDFEQTLGRESPAWLLWDTLRGREDGGWGIGQTRASKIMARKRPHLIPIWDSVISKETQLRNSATQWVDWHEALTADGGKLAARLDDIQRAAQLPVRISRLRVMDVVLWMHGTEGKAVDRAAEE